MGGPPWPPLVPSSALTEDPEIHRGAAAECRPYKSLMDADDPTPHLERFQTYEKACREFRWLIPERFNIAHAICRRHSDAVSRIALNEVRDGGNNTFTFGALDYLSDKFATALSQSGVSQGDSVAVILPQSAAAVIANLAALKTGSAVVPLAMSSDLETMTRAVAHCRARALVIDETILNAAQSFAEDLMRTESLFVVRDLRPDAPAPNCKYFWTEVDRSSSDFQVLETEARSPALIFYAEHEGEPNAVVHSHASLIGQLTAFEMCGNIEPGADSVFWTPNDWSSPGAMLGMLYPAWWYGGAVVADSQVNKVTHSALALSKTLRSMARCEVTHAFVTSPQLGTLTREKLDSHSDLKLRTVIHEGQPSAALDLWATRGITVNQVYGKAETGWVAGGCERWFQPRSGSVGRAAPGHRIEIIGENGDILAPHKTGRVCVHKSDPSLFREYFNSPERTAQAFIGDWFWTGDVGNKNEEGDLYIGR